MQPRSLLSRAPPCNLQGFFCSKNLRPHLHRLRRAPGHGCSCLQFEASGLVVRVFVVVCVFLLVYVCVCVFVCLVVC